MTNAPGAPIFVFGHRNPDNDSVCSAAAYAHLKNIVDPSRVYIAGRLGEIAPETAWVFDRFHAEVPELVPHVRTRARDVMVTEIVTAHPDDVVLSVGRLMRERGVRSVPVVDGNCVARGIVTMDTLARTYLDELQVPGFSRVPTTVGRLVEALDGRLLVGEPQAALSGGVIVAAMEPDTLLSKVTAGDTVVMGDRRRSQPAALAAGAACLVVTGGSDPTAEALAAARASGAAVIATDHGTFAAARLIGMSHAVSEIMDTDVLTVSADALLSEVSEDVFASPHRLALVADDDGSLAGLVTRTNLAKGHRREVILVDHNESSQSADGIDQAAVVEIVDHHRIGDIQTSRPIAFRNVPVGSTATIVVGAYDEHRVDIPERMAGLLLSAVLTDTVLLKSPTATPADRDVAERLAQQLGVSITDFGMRVFKSRQEGVAFDVERVVGADLKEFRLADGVVAVGQYETADASSALEHRAGLLAQMEQVRERLNCDLVLLMVTDIVREGTELLAVGRTRFAERAFDVTFADGSVWLPGVLSRKQQVAARLIDASDR